MRLTTCFYRFGLLGLVLACAPCVSLQAEPRDERDAKDDVKQSSDADEQRAPESQRDEAAGWWIGVQCVPIHDPALRAQLDLERGEGGLLVEDVLPDSPADKAGMKRFDVLLTAGGSRLHDMHMLQRAINGAVGGELKIELYRGGKKQTVVVKPAERRGSFGPGSGIAQNPQDSLQQWLERRWNLPPQSMPPQSMYFFGPGVVMPQAERGLPDDMSVTITRKGKEPATLIVKKGDKTWETTEDRLSELPPQARREVEKLLPRQLPPVVRPDGAPFVGRGSRELSETLERQRREIDSQIDQVRKRLERLEHQARPDQDNR